MKIRRALERTVLALVIFTGGACGAIKPAEPKFIDDIRKIPPPLKVINFTIQRRDLQDALTRTNENTIRLVPVFQTASLGPSYEYRVFDVKNGSVFNLLGIQVADIVIAADRYLIKRPEQFSAFVQIMAGLDEASIEIRRGGESRLLRYRFVPAVGKDGQG